MKKTIIALSAAAIIAGSGSASAESSTPSQPIPVATESVLVEGSPVVSSAPYVRPRRQVSGARRGGVLSNLIELERRKNAWLKRTFLGR